MNAFEILLDELHSQHEQLDAAVKRDAAKPGFDFKPFIADEGPARAAAGFRLSQETTTLASKLPNKLEPLYRAALNQLIAFEPRLTELIRVHEAFIEAAVNAANDEADCIDPAASKRHWDQIRECQRIAAVASQTDVVVDTATLEQDLPTIGKNALAVLKKLDNTSPVSCTLDDITAFDRKTAGNLIKELIEAGYAHRPNGKRRGATVTEAGKRLAKSIS